jgi:hypothetical protein
MTTRKKRVRGEKKIKRRKQKEEKMASYLLDQFAPIAETVPENPHCKIK